jgi:hypothetical protein
VFFTKGDNMPRGIRGSRVVDPHRLIMRASPRLARAVQVVGRSEGRSAAAVVRASVAAFVRARTR